MDKFYRAVSLFLFFLVLVAKPPAAYSEKEILGWLEYKEKVLVSVPLELSFLIPTSTRPPGTFSIAKVEKVLVKPGEEVKKGEVMIVLEDLLARAQLKRAEANLEVVKAQKNLLKEKRKEIEDKLSDLIESEKKIGQAETQAQLNYQKGISQLKKAKEEINRKLLGVKEGEGILIKALGEVKKGISALEEQIERVKMLPGTDPSRQLLLQELEKKLTSLEFEKGALNQRLIQLETARKKLVFALLQIESGLKEAPLKYQRGKRKILKAKNRLKKAQTQLLEAREKVDFQLSLVPYYLKQAESLKEISEKVFNLTRLRTPADGMVVSLNVKPGEVVFPGQVLLEIADPERIVFKGYLKASQELTALSQNYQVKVDSFPELSFKAWLLFLPWKEEFAETAVISEESELSRVLEFRLAVDNSNKLLKPGFPATAFLKNQK